MGQEICQDRETSQDKTSSIEKGEKKGRNTCKGKKREEKKGKAKGEEKGVE